MSLTEMLNLRPFVVGYVLDAYICSVDDKQNPLAFVKMNTKHTPGPWIAHEDAIFQEKPHGEVSPLICDTINGRKFTGEERGANARLIAAAPELLDALQSLLARVSSDIIANQCWHEEQRAARAAIAKATNP